MTAADRVGREAELASIAAVLARRRPALVAITGERGSGKSYVAFRAIQAAAEAGWRATRYVNGRGVRVGQGTTEAMVVQSVARDLGLADVPAAGPASTFPTLVAGLARAARRDPVLVVLDPYRPPPELAHRIVRELVPAVRATGLPIVFMVLARRALRDELAPDLEVAVKPPEVNAVERTLRAAGEGLEPPLDEAELAVYVDAARTNPRLLTSLAAVLPLSRRGAGHDIPAPPTGLTGRS